MQRHPPAPTSTALARSLDLRVAFVDRDILLRLRAPFPMSFTVRILVYTCTSLRHTRAETPKVHVQVFFP